MPPPPPFFISQNPAKDQVLAALPPVVAVKLNCSSERKNLPLSCKTLYLESDVILTVPAVKTLDTPYFHNKVWLPKSRTTQVSNMFEPDTAT